MSFFKKRRLKKEIKETLHHAKHIRHMHEDIADPELLDCLRRAEKQFSDAGKTGDRALIEKAEGELAAICGKIAPPRPQPKIRENVEVVFVAIAAAMAIRAYFFQPFKIPTGSMQPTLYGITIQAEPTIKANNPLANLANMVLFGERHTVIKAKTSGLVRLSAYGTQLDLQTTKSQSAAIFFIDDVAHKVPMSLWHKQSAQFYALVRKNNGYIQKGDVLFDGVTKSGDYILVNRLKYNFIRPKRGDITVFDTRDLTHPDVRNNAYYIKRMVGLPGETISLAPPYLLVNGEKPNNPRFDKIFKNENYDGYVFGSPAVNPVLLSKASDTIKLKNDEYLFFGDNTRMSLDARYFGAVNRKRILGPAFFVCWPINRAGFAEVSH